VDKRVILVDIDDCIIDVSKRKAAIYSYLLNKKIKVNEVIGKRTSEFLREHVKEDLVEEYRVKFWEIALCLDEIGKKFLNLDRPVPYAKQVLKKLSKKYNIIYISNRIESMKDITIEELKKFDFPSPTSVYHADDSTFLNSLQVGRINVLSKLPKVKIFTVIDDLPENYIHYKQLNVNYIIGFLKYIVLDKKKFYEMGANFVIESWKDFPLNLFI